MNADEKAIIDYLKAWPHSFVSGRELARKAVGKERYYKDRDWAVSVLTQMVRNGLLETDVHGYFRLKKEDVKRRTKAHVSPHIMKILKSSGKDFKTFVIDDDSDGQGL